MTGILHSPQPAIHSVGIRNDHDDEVRPQAPSSWCERAVLLFSTVSDQHSVSVDVGYPTRRSLLEYYICPQPPTLAESPGVFNIILTEVPDRFVVVDSVAVDWAGVC